MQTIRITISTEKPANVVITEKKAEIKETKRKALKALEAMFKPLLNGGKRSCE
ncbi:MAG: hypothetical protein H6Q73_1794 [Firmicutes bacterium]|nr:hypothetical protein [Bacillota bacterium]